MGQADEMADQQNTAQQPFHLFSYSRLALSSDISSEQAKESPPPIEPTNQPQDLDP